MSFFDPSVDYGGTNADDGGNVCEAVWGRSSTVGPPAFRISFGLEEGNFAGRSSTASTAPRAEIVVLSTSLADRMEPGGCLNRGGVTGWLNSAVPHLDCVSQVFPPTIEFVTVERSWSQAIYRGMLKLTGVVSSSTRVCRYRHVFYDAL